MSTWLFLPLLPTTCLWLSVASASSPPKCCPWDHVLAQETASSPTARCLPASASATALVRSLETNATFVGCSRDDTDRAFRIVGLINSTEIPNGQMWPLETCMDVVSSPSSLHVSSAECDRFECKTRPCVRVCCPRGARRNHADVCVQQEETEDESFSVVLHEPSGRVSSAPTDDVKFFYGEPRCSSPLSVLANATLFEDGVLRADGAAFRHNEYCFDRVGDANDSEGQKEVFRVCTGKTTNTSWPLWLALPTSPASSSELDLSVVREVVLPVLYSLSLLFLLATWVGVWRRSRHRLFGMMTLCTVATLFLFYAVLIVPQLAGPEHVRTHPTLCAAEGLAIVFLHVSAVCWLNCMAHSIWKAFRSVSVPSDRFAQGAASSERFRKLVRYACWSLGCPTVLCVAIVAVHAVPEQYTDSAGIISPQLGVARCFLGDGLPTLVYFHLVTGPSLALNVAAYFRTSYNLCCGVFAPHKDQRVTFKVTRPKHQRAATIAKLFFVMGLSWLSEFFSWALSYAFGTPSSWVAHASFLFDCLNALQGLVIFVVVILYGHGISAGAGASVRKAEDVFIVAARRHAPERNVIPLASKARGEEGSQERALIAWIRRLRAPFRKTYSYDLTTVEQLYY